MTKVIITGARGRMGQALMACAPRLAEIEIAGAIELGEDLAPIVASGDVILDFSAHEATAGFAELCAMHRKALVIGTTGHTEIEKSRILALKTAIRIVWSSNYSTGVNTLFWLARKTAEILGPDFDIEVVEMHHRRKQDAPSGTAATLGEILAGARKLQIEKAVRHGRHGLVGPRTAAEIGIHAIRGGDVVGDHTVIFAADGERVELAHKASSRETFAIGALRAASWVLRQPPGIYSMQDVLGLH